MPCNLVYHVNIQIVKEINEEYVVTNVLIRNTLDLEHIHSRNI
jgi:hypothetical protein